MGKVILILANLATLLIAESMCQHIIYPTYRPPPQRPVIIRTARDTSEPLWLWQGDNIDRAPATGDHPFLPKYIDDIRMDPNRRYARSLSTPRATRGGGTRQSSSRDTGPTHPGYNRRNAREIRLPSLPGFTKPCRHQSTWYPCLDHQPIPLYIRDKRDVSQEQLDSQEQLTQFASQEQLRTRREALTLASKEHTELDSQEQLLASQEQLRTRREALPLASQEHTELDSQEQLSQFASQEQLRTRREALPLASQEHTELNSQEHLSPLASQEQLRTRRAALSLASQEHTELDSQEQLSQFASQEQLRTRREALPLASQEHTELDSQEQLSQFASQEQLRTRREALPLASQEHTELDSQEHLFASQEQ